MKRQTLLLSLLAVLLLASCASRKNFVYLQDMQVGEGYPFDTTSGRPVEYQCHLQES